MTPLLNLLPWRQRRRLRKRYQWSFVAVGCLALMVLANIALPHLMAWRHDRLRLQHEYLLQMNAALQRKYLAAQELKELRLIQEKKTAQREAFKTWEARLITLARRLPANVWLVSLSFKNEQMLIKGYARQSGDIQQLEKRLRQLEGISAVKTGAIQQDEKGLMRFIFTVTFSEATHVLPS